MDKLAEDDPENRNCYQSMIYTDHEPCLALDDEGRKLGIGNLFEHTKDNLSPRGTNSDNPVP